MLYTVPAYYKKFQCLAGNCPATCCAGWQIVIDQKALRRYADLKGRFGNRVKNSVDWKEQTFLQYGKRCAFLNEDNLCDMHIEAGHEMLCATCRKYPRHVEVFDNEREISLSLSCPAAAELILERKSVLTFLHAEDEKQDKEEGDFDSFLYSALQDTRNQLFVMMQNRKEGIFLRMAKTLALSHDVQNRIDRKRIFEMEEILAHAGKESVQKRLEKKLFRKASSGTKTADVQELFTVLDEWEVLDESWKRDVKQWKEMFAMGVEKEVFQRFWKSQPNLQTECEQMVVYYLFTYFCGAVYDGEALAKTKMAVYSTLIWVWSCLALWLQNGEKLTGKERLELAWRYSRELEHSDLNLNKMDDLAGIHPELSTDKLMERLMLWEKN